MGSGLSTPGLPDRLRKPLAFEHVVIYFLLKVVLGCFNKQGPLVSFHHHVLGSYFWNSLP
jgi:hypothetical protein